MNCGLTSKEIARIRGAIRLEHSRYSVTKKKALSMSVNPYKKGKRGGAMCICAKCKESFTMRDVQVDHIDPVVPVGRELQSWDEYICRLFCGVDNLQVLCKPCHKEKSNNENSQRT